jgi:class 3 adenylate cyclase
MEGKGYKSGLTDKLQADGKSFLDMASNFVDDMKTRSEKAKSVLDLEKETTAKKRELNAIILSLGEDMVITPVSATENVPVEKLKTKIRNHGLRIRELEVELKKLMEEVSRDDLAVLLQKRKDLEEDVNEITEEILEKYGQSLTIIFTDMKGFTEKSSQKGLVNTMEMLDEHDRILIPVIKRFNGRVIKQIGDAIMASFKSPADAVLASMEIQKQLKKYNETADGEKKIQVRIGVNCGMVIVKEADLFGDTVNIASRVEGLADGEEIFITESVYDYLDKQEIAVEQLEPRQVKGIKEAIRIFKVLY